MPASTYYQERERAVPLLASDTCLSPSPFSSASVDTPVILCLQTSPPSEEDLSPIQHAPPPTLEELAAAQEEVDGAVGEAGAAIPPRSLMEPSWVSQSTTLLRHTHTHARTHTHTHTHTQEGRYGDENVFEASMLLDLIPTVFALCRLFQGVSA